MVATRPLTCLLLPALLSLPLGNLGAQALRRPVPDKLVVLTFDDASLSHATYVAPLLKRYGFGATFFVCEFREPPFADKTKYMSWEQIRQLDRMGFEVGSHTLTHRHVNKLSREQIAAELDSIETRCRQYGIARPTTFAYPGYDTHPLALEVLRERGYQFARTGGSKQGYTRAYAPAADHPYLVPSYSTTGNNREQVYEALKQAKDGRVVVLTIHGVPDAAHDWVSTPPALFEEYLRYLKAKRYRVIALRELGRYVDVPRALGAHNAAVPVN
ncbi:polysaccharide deacetylase family protein [Solirubrum puertoriconensis]|uniref:Polysaccharide deacetylase n=1 Tax=Solirubrum puertoriconensis TaxID=1751427 RepID=A0A9X0L600_SOLP1|nr:polysaccharide deacetylase family protein [Solirubrum puertoriconensis]KUG09154.1 polysaccharide deacetylase [Solirubrum puertoriconensis]